MAPRRCGRARPPGDRAREQGDGPLLRHQQQIAVGVVEGAAVHVPVRAVEVDRAPAPQGRAPAEIQVSLRAPKGSTVQRVTVNGRPAALAGRRGDAVVIRTGSERRFEIAANLT